MKPKHYPTVLLMFAAFIFFVLQPVWAQQPVFRLGILDAERGPITRGARLAVEEINNAGGVRGADGTLFRLDLIIEPVEPGGNLAGAAAVLNSSNIIAALGPAESSDVLNNLANLQGLNVPVITPATDDTLLTVDTTDRVFRSRSSQILQGQALAAYLVNELRLQRITTVQLDVASTKKVIGFDSAAGAFGVRPQTVLPQNGIDPLVAAVIQSNPEAVVAFGAPEAASQLYNLLREESWDGLFAYDQIDDPAFTESIAFNLLQGIISTTTWPFAAIDPASVTFLDSFVRHFGAVPGAIDAASYDAVYLLAAAIGRPGELLNNLSVIDNLRGVQGLLRPAQLGKGEISNNVAVLQIGPLGAPAVVARYAGGVRLPDDQPQGPVAVGTPLPAPSATPEGVVITITNQVQNIRTGPSTQFEVLAQAREGEQYRVIGASRDNAWVVIEFRGRQGWLATYLLDVFGDLNTVPIIDSPPTPTPNIPPTPIPPQEADIRIDSAAALPTPIIPNQQFSVNVVVRNAGISAAGPFAIAATFPPNNVFTSATIGGLAPGQTTVVTLIGTLSNTGFYTVTIVADLNNQVPEGVGEGNNNFNFSYSIDKVILNQGQRTLNAGESFDLEGNNQADVSWNINGQQLDALGPARLRLLNNVTLESLHWDLLNPATIDRTTVSRSSMSAGAVIGVLTADGNRGAIRVDDLPGNQMRLTFRVYQN